MKTNIVIMAGMLMLILSGCGGSPKEEIDLSTLDLNSLTPEKYKAFNRLVFEDYQVDAQAVGEDARDIIITMAGLEDRPESHGVFEVDVNFNINAMLLLVANANQIKRELWFLDEFKRQIASTKLQLSTEDERLYFKVFTEALLSEQNGL